MAPARGPCGGGGDACGRSRSHLRGDIGVQPPPPERSPREAARGGGAATPRGPLLLRVARAKPGRPGQDPQAAASGGGGAG